MNPCGRPLAYLWTDSCLLINIYWELYTPSSVETDFSKKCSTSNFEFEKRTGWHQEKYTIESKIFFHSHMHPEALTMPLEADLPEDLPADPDHQGRTLVIPFLCLLCQDVLQNSVVCKAHFLMRLWPIHYDKGLIQLWGIACMHKEILSMAVLALMRPWVWRLQHCDQHLGQKESDTQPACVEKILTAVETRRNTSYVACDISDVWETDTTNFDGESKAPEGFCTKTIVNKYKNEIRMLFSPCKCPFKGSKLIQYAYVGKIQSDLR